MSWKEVKAYERPAGAMVCLTHIALNKSLMRLMGNPTQCDVLVDGKRLGLRAGGSGRKLCSYRDKDIRLSCAGAIMEIGAWAGDRLLLTGVEDGIFILEKVG